MSMARSGMFRMSFNRCRCGSARATRTTTPTSPFQRVSIATVAGWLGQLPGWPSSWTRLFQSLPLPVGLGNLFCHATGSDSNVSIAAVAGRLGQLHPKRTRSSGPSFNRCRCRSARATPRTSCPTRLSEVSIAAVAGRLGQPRGHPARRGSVKFQSLPLPVGSGNFEIAATHSFIAFQSLPLPVGSGNR